MRTTLRTGVSISSVVAALLLSNAGGAAAVRLRQPHGTNFLSICRFSHSAPDDPIVHPGVPGASHPHEFFGNVSTDAHSTLKSLRAHGTTCNRATDTAAYWVPALYRNGQPIRPIEASIYYRIQSIGKIRPFPPGLKVVAGNAAATKPQSTKITFWNCNYPPGPSEPSALVPQCPRRRARMLRPPRTQLGSLRLNVNFPDCWDGRHLDSPDHKSHMAYSHGDGCPSSHPVKVPSLRLTVMYPIRGGSGLALASGGLFSAHADFFNGWNQLELTRIVRACATEKPRCAAPSP